MELIEIEDRLDKQTIIYDFVPLEIESKETSLYINDQSRGVIRVIARLKLANRHAGLAVCANLEDRHAKDDIDAWTKGRFLEGQVAACVSYGWRIILLVVGRAVTWVLRGLAQPLRSAYTLLRTGNGLKVYIWGGRQSKCPGRPEHLSPRSYSTCVSRNFKRVPWWCYKIFVVCASKTSRTIQFVNYLTLT